jgi:sugar (pentulose or hexulose) kinase
MYLALDLGSTHFKAGVFDSDLTACGRASHPIATRCEPGGVVEVDAAAVRGGLDAVVRDALAAAGVPGQRLRALALTSQAQTFTLLDAGGEPRTPFLSWQDARARLAAADLAQSDLGVGGDVRAEDTGHKIIAPEP